jgi:hypothetical protein
MAVAVVLDFQGATLAQYDEVTRRMGLAPGGPGPSGALFHWATETDGGFRVTDVWESREQFEAFARDSIMPITREVGMSDPPQVTFHDVHNFFTANPTAGR